MNLLNGVVILILLASIPTNVSAVSSSECEDEYEFCPLLTDNCDLEFVKKACPKSCGICGCEDQLDFCPALIKECDLEIVKKTCPKTCGTTCAKAISRKEYKLKVVAKKLKREAARQHCVDYFDGNLIQHDARLYTREGRQEIAQSLNLPIGRSYHTGIRRDGNQIWRKSSDGEEVKLKDWYPSYPASATSAEFLYWGFWNNSDKNTIWNSSDRSYHFICEY